MNMPIPQPETTTEQIRQTTCPYCGVGCGVDISCNVSARAITLDNVKGTPEHPANFGRLCIKGANLLETNDLKGRLLFPTIAGERVDWDTATSTIADKITSTIAQYGADAVAFYVSGQLLTEDYYIANKLMKGFIGSANIDTNSRLCMSSAVSAYKRAFGEDVVPCNYSDLENTDLLVITGSNTAWAHPVLFQRITRAKLRNPNMKVVVIDPRRTETCTIADVHLAIKPGSDVALFNGLLDFAQSTDRINYTAVSQFAEGLASTLESAASLTIEEVVQQCDIPTLQLKAFYSLFCSSPRVVTFYSMGVNQSAFGVDKAQSIINCHLALDLIGKEGCGPFSITGQPNAMGGREVGGLANMLAAHLDLDNEAHVQAVQTYWNAPVMPAQQGLKAVDLFNAVEQGKVKFIWIMGTNPVVSMPNRLQVERALRKCDMVVVSDIVASNDTLNFAHVALPATGWSEKNGTVTNSERRISRQRGILAAPGEAKHDWQIMCDVAKAMGFDGAFSFSHPAQIFSEYAGLTGYQNDGKRLLDLSPLQGLSEAQYDGLSPIQWPIRQAFEQGDELVSLRPFADKQFPTASGKARLVPVKFNPPLQLTNTAYPFIVNSGRVRDQWHTMTRTGKTTKLLAHMTEACVHIHPDDGETLGLSNGDLASLKSAAMETTSMKTTAKSNDDEVSEITNNETKVKAKVNDNGITASAVIYPVKIEPFMRKGEVFIPIHWSGQWGSHSKLGALYTSAVDAISGQPELKHAAASITPVSYDVYGSFLFGEHCDECALKESVDFWAKTLVSTSDNAEAVALNFAKNGKRADIVKALLTVLPQNAVQHQFHHNDYSVCIALKNDVLCFIAVLSDEPMTPKSECYMPSNWLASLLDNPLSLEKQYKLMRCEVDESFLNGSVVCSCFNVREKPINEAIKNGVNSVNELGLKLKCGTNCGSCKPALADMLSQSKSIKFHAN